MLANYAAWRGRMALPAQGAPTHEHLRIAAERGSATAQRELVGPPVPSSLRYLWDATVELISGLAPSGFGGLSVSWRDMLAWAQLTGRSLSPWETRTVFRMAGAYLASSMPVSGSTKER